MYFKGSSLEIKQLDNVILFGTAGLLQHALHFCKKNNLTVKFLSDNNEKIHHTIIEGIQVIPPKDIHKYDYPILIISMYAYEIAKQLDNLSIKNYYDFSYVFEYDRWYQHFDIKFIQTNKEKINQVIDLLADEKSKSFFRSLIKYRKTSNPIHIQPADFPDYFHPQVSPKYNDFILDCGAWEGDSAIDFIKKLNNKCKIYCFEPEKETFSTLIKNTKKFEYVQNFNYGVSNENETLYFHKASNNMQHRVVDYVTDNKIDVVTLDSFLSSELQKINFIKMDIEGSEMNALLGAKNLIRQYQPKLAICIYHLKGDLWEIPLLIKQLNPNYKLYIGHHSQNLFDTVIYAI